MTAPRDEQFRRLLRWYPRSWREAHGEVLLGTMLDQAETENRTLPTRSERWTAFTHGSGARLNARFAVRSAIAALCLSVLGALGWLWVTSSLSVSGALVTTILSAAVAPLLSAVSVIASLRHRGFFSDTRALILCAVMVVALTLNLLTQLAWSLGFDAADAGIATTGLAALLIPLALAAWVTGAVAAALTLDALFRRTRVSASAQTILTGGVSVIATPFFGLALISPQTSAFLALGAALLAGMTTRTVHREAASPALRPALRRALPAQTSARRGRLVQLFAVVSTLAGALGVTYALTGALWSPLATDGTVAMRQGIIILLVAAMPLLGATGIVVVGRSRHRPAHVWGPLGATALSLMAVLIAYTGTPEWEDMAAGMITAAFLGGLAIAWWLAPRLKFARAFAVTVSALTGLVYASTLGIFVTPLLVFAVPLLGVTLTILGGRIATETTLSSRAERDNR